MPFGYATGSVEPVGQSIFAPVAKDPILEALWAKALTDWDQPSVHEAFIKHCVESEQLGEAAGRYKSKVHPDGPDHDDAEQAIARKRLGGIATVALARVQAESEEVQRRKEAGPSRTIVNCAALAVIFGLLVAAASVLI